MREQPILIIGHKNPDLDTVASVLAYERFKKATGQNSVQACIPGPINRETEYVLEKMGLDAPPIVEDVRVKVVDLLDDESAYAVRPSDKLHTVAMNMRENGMKTVPVVDGSNRLIGLFTIGDLAMTFMEQLNPSIKPEAAADAIQNVWDAKVSTIMRTDNLIHFEESDPIEEARQTMLKTRFRNYPVVDENHHYLGMISRHHLLKPNQKKLILLDHNEMKQAVEGIEEAELVEIIDHHRLGDLESIHPIYFRNDPVGATSTLIAETYERAGLTPDRAIAGLLMAGILSDTMIFRSPTTTKRDREAVLWLAEITGLDPEEWGRAIFREASPPLTGDPIQLVTEDLKEFAYGDTVFAVAQIETADMSMLAKNIDIIRKTMDNTAQNRGYDLMFLMITDIFIGGTRLLVSGDRAPVGIAAFGGTAGGDIFLKDVMSRKKQVVPIIYQALARQDMM